MNSLVSKVKKQIIQVILNLLDHLAHPWENAYKKQPNLGEICHVILLTEDGMYLNTSGVCPTYNGLIWILSDSISGLNVEVPFLCGPVIAWRYAIQDRPDEKILDERAGSNEYYKK